MRVFASVLLICFVASHSLAQAHDSPGSVEGGGLAAVGQASFTQEETAAPIDITYSECQQQDGRIVPGAFVRYESGVGYIHQLKCAVPGYPPCISYNISDQQGVYPVQQVPQNPCGGPGGQPTTVPEASDMMIERSEMAPPIGGFTPVATGMKGCCGTVVPVSTCQLASPCPPCSGRRRCFLRRCLCR